MRTPKPFPTSPAIRRAAIAASAAAVAAAALWPVPAPAEEKSRAAKDVVEASCAACHREGKKGAPRIGDKKAWTPRLSKGLDTLVLAGIRGHDGMPPRGGRADLTDAELRAAILYMFDPKAPPKKAP